MTEGWGLLETHIEKYMKSHQSTLERSQFENLLEVGRAQGAINELRKVVLFVQKCTEKIKE